MSVSDFSAENKVSPPEYWLGKPYYSLDAFFKQKFSQKIYKISLNAGLTCPNRDGTLGRGGCIFCSSGGSGDFAAPLLDRSSIRESLEKGKSLLHRKQTGSRFMAYFQAFTNTYGPVSYLEQIYRGALELEEIIGISIATRPDCLPDEVLSLLSRLKDEYPDKLIWIELGLQTIHKKTAHFIRRGYELPCFEKAIHSLAALDIPVIVHLILGLPGETDEDMYASVSYLNALPVSGVKLQLLHILKGTDLADLYEKDPASICLFPDRDDYLAVLIRCLMLLSPDIVVHRVTGDGSRSLLTAPLWSLDKRGVLNALHKQMREQNAFQGALFPGSSSDESFFSLF